MNILNELKNREILKDITNTDKFEQLKNEAIYIGFDPTAISLHLGNYVQMTILKRFKEAGFEPIAVLGGATGMIGDPSGKSEERNLLSEADLQNNKDKIRKQLESHGFKVIDNYDFYKDMNVLDFMRQVGKLLNINYMMAKDSVSSRLETGISFTEFSYQLIQGWDFKELYDKHNVRIQVGGSDQWGNITSGVELIRKTIGDENLAVGITTNLLTTSDGKKFGKSEGNALWLEPSMTTPFQMYQYLVSANDSDVDTFLKWLTFIPVEEIKEVMAEHGENPSTGFAQKKLAYEVVKDIHGKDAAEEALTITAILYGGADISNMSAKEILSLEGSVPTFSGASGKLIDVLVGTKLAQSNREAREFLTSGSISINGTKVEDENFEVTPSYDGKANVIRRGKKKTILIKY